MRSIRVLIIKSPTGDDFYKTYVFGWQEIPPEELINGEKKLLEEYWQKNEYNGETIFFLDAVKTEEKVFIDIKALLGEESPR